jgi:hypothetical protein
MFEGEIVIKIVNPTRGISVLGEGAEGGAIEDVEEVFGMGVPLSLGVDVVDGKVLIKREKGTSMEVYVASDLMERGAGKSMLDCGCSKLEVALLFIGHEIHHLTEPDRLRACEVEAGDHTTGLAGAMNPDMPKKWMAFVRRFLKESGEVNLNKNFSKTIGIANEACADLLGFHFLEKIRCVHPEKWPNGIEKAKESLVALRERESQSRKKMKVVDLYNYSDFLRKAQNVNFEEYIDIVRYCWIALFPLSKAAFTLTLSQLPQNLFEAAAHLLHVQQCERPEPLHDSPHDFYPVELGTVGRQKVDDQPFGLPPLEAVSGRRGRVHRPIIEP